MLSQETHTLNSCTMHFAKTTHPNVIPGQQQLTNTLITWHEMWASHIHNNSSPTAWRNHRQQDKSIRLLMASMKHNVLQLCCGLELQKYVTGDKEVLGNFLCKVLCNTAVCLWLSQGCHKGRDMWAARLSKYGSSHFYLCINITQTN